MNARDLDGHTLVYLHLTAVNSSSMKINKLLQTTPELPIAEAVTPTCLKD